jgi:hypothetical protein
MDLRLEHLELGLPFISRFPSDHASLEFLRRQVDLKFLGLNLSDYSIEVLNVIWDLKNLETLELRGDRISDQSCLNNLHKLGKLKRLKVGQEISSNILDHMKFGVFKNLEELDASFKGASLESVKELNQITPNLKKIEITSVSSDIVNAVLKTLENLESLEIDTVEWKMIEKVYPKMKRLSFVHSPLKLNPQEFSKAFPNLEYLKIDRGITVNESFFAELLSGLKQLKRLHMRIRSGYKLDPKLVLQYMQEHGKQLEEVEIPFNIFNSLGLGFKVFTIEKKLGERAIHVNHEGNIPKR